MTRFVFWLVICFLSTFSFVYFYYKSTDSNTRINGKIIIVFMFGVFLSTCVECFDLETLSYVSYFLYFPVMFYLLKRMPIKKLFFYVMIVWFIAIAIDIISILVTSLAFYLFDINISVYINNSELVSIFLTVCVSTVLIVLGKINFLDSYIFSLYQKIKNVKYSDILLVIFVLFISFIGITMFLNIENVDINVLSMIVLILAIFSFILLFRYKINETESVMYLNTLRENNEFYIKMEDENRIFKHNLVAKLLSIKSVSNKKAMALIEDLIMQFNKSVDFSKNMKVIPYGLNGIIYQKLYPYMKELNIEISNELGYDIFDILKPRRYNVFIEKMVIALDNAIESCLKSNNKSLVINIFDEDNSISIEIENTIGNDINLDLLGNKNYSTKGNRHGLGLFSAFRNNEASLKVKIINNIFVSKITAKKHPID